MKYQIQELKQNQRIIDVGNVKTVNKQIMGCASFAKTNLVLVGQEGSSNHVLRGSV